ncbi:MAG: sigma-70 family RNA polymerase sigma factor [Lachnospiraceae bacterium]|nr:sigma-70 family RNA polymerase sigma factor [Lachnospiraceae bacterium]
MSKIPDKNNTFGYPDYEDVSDEKLIERMHEVSYEYPAILNFLISRHTGLVFNIVKNINGIMPSDVDDFRQEGMIGLYDAIEKYDPSKGAGFRTYASVVIKNRILNTLSSRNSLKNSPLKDYISTDVSETDPQWNENKALQSPDMTPEEIALFDELKEKFGLAFRERLTESERISLSLKMKGVPVRKIAGVLGITEKAAEKAISRARKKIRDSI